MTTEPAKAATIIVALDGTEQALAALPVARAFADLRKATLHVLHITERALPPAELLRKLGLSADDLRGSVIDQVAGNEAEAIVNAVREQQSLGIVMCTHTGSGEPTRAVSNVAREVLLAAHCPVVLVPPGRGIRPMQLRHMLLPYDGSPATAAAIGLALKFAEEADAQVQVLHVATAHHPEPVEPGTLAVPQYIDQPHHEWPAWGHEILQRVCCLAHAGEIRRLRLALTSGDPGREVVRYALENPTDLIVLAWHGTLEPERAESTKFILREAPCPVLVLRIEPEKKD